MSLHIPAIQAPPPSEERGLASSPIKYFLLTVAIAAIAASVFHLFMPASIVLLIGAGWFLWSATIIWLNRVADGTMFESTISQLHSLANEINSVIASSWLFPLTLFSSYHNPKGNPEGQPILMVNGYLSFGSTWHYQREKLAEEGFGPIYTMNVGSGKSIRTYAEEVDEKIEQIRRETGRNDIVLVGHSRGGLVSSYYATYIAPGRQVEVTDLITIGSPLCGTPIAHYGPGHDAEEMRPEHIFHRDLREHINAHEGTRFFHIGSKTDEIVPISSALIGDDAQRQFLLKDTGHLGLLFSSRVADQITRWLRP
ncbi:MAG: hypothetical protein K1X28_05080 [Parachlamydiales bacterium]|nr:hypothetical protein [Parachlamydiales bacterium]